MGRFEMITGVPISAKDFPPEGCGLIEESDPSSQIHFEPGDVFGFFMPRTAGGGTIPSFWQCYSTNISSGPSHTLYYMNVAGIYPSCVISLCDPAMQTLSGVQLQIKVSIGQEKMEIISCNANLCYSLIIKSV